MGSGVCAPAAMMEQVHACRPSLQCTSTVNMGGDVGALLAQSGWLFVGVPNHIKVRPNPQAALHFLMAACHGRAPLVSFQEKSTGFPSPQETGETGWAEL